MIIQTENCGPNNLYNLIKKFNERRRFGGGGSDYLTPPPHVCAIDLHTCITLYLHY